jgi:hypothetical protein
MILHSVMWGVTPCKRKRAVPEAFSYFNKCLQNGFLHQKAKIKYKHDLAYK